jgi:SAM-dependent methyltransferase
MKRNTEELYYGYRLNIYISIGLLGIGAVCIALAIAFTALSYSIWVLILCWVLGVILLILGLFYHFSMTAVATPAKLKIIVDSFLDMLRTIWNGQGNVLDIGTGNGQTAVMIASQYPEAQVTGVDTWTKMWKAFGQTKASAEKNAKLVKVDSRCIFQHGNALELPFQDGEFSLVVSNSVFHEISVPDRTVLLKEAIRVLSPGGTLAIFDWFSIKSYKVNNVTELLQKVQQMGVEDVKFTTLKELGINLGWLSGIWSLAFLTGRKKAN